MTRIRTSTRRLLRHTLLMSVLMASGWATLAQAETTGADPVGDTQPATRSRPEMMNCIVQAEDLATARSAVIEAGGAIANDLKVIRAVNAFLTADQRAALEALPDISVWDNDQVKPSATHHASSIR